MKRFLLALLVLWPSAAFCQAFTFVAYGDTAYMLPRDAPRVQRLIDAINREQPVFAIHVGDFKGYSSCSDAAYREQKAIFARHLHPVILTPGDNDWTDCSVETAGGFDPLERLAALRRTFFSNSDSLGGKTLRLIRQSTVYPENARWSHDGVIFATVHVVGPNNGLVRDSRLATESIDRSAAGEQWIREAFDIARKANAPALVLAFQADPWASGAPSYENGPYDWLQTAIGEEARRFNGQVLVINGDSHRLTIDTPYRRTNIDAGTTTGLNITRLMVPGWPDHRAIRVDVDTKRAGMFEFGVVMNAEEEAGAKP